LAEKADLCVLVSAGAEWRALLTHFPEVDLLKTPYGKCFHAQIGGQRSWFLHGEWGKVAAAGSTQYAVDRWRPKRVINIGTCGGFKGHIERGEVILAKKTIIYDIFEQMSDPNAAIERYAVDLDLSWLPDPPPQPVRVGTLVSADRDIDPRDITELIEKYGAFAADWESGAIAWVAQRNGVPCLVLRAVSDLVDGHTAEAYGDYAFFEAQCQEIMSTFIHHLPGWIEAFWNDGGQKTGDR
jgi:adenosylhomocysteine nucleosidase